MAATIKDIAKRLNISVSTVSYALNGGPRPVPDEVREKVVAVARELNYRPNWVARSMVTGRTNTIGVIPSGTGPNSFLSPYVIAVLNSITNIASTRNQDLLLVTGFRTDRPAELVDHLLGGRVDGAVFIAPGFEPSVIRDLREAGLAVVTIAGPAIPGVTDYRSDNREGVFSALRHLVDLGHRKIANISGRPNMADTTARQRAYVEFLERNDLPRRPEWMAEGNFVIEGGFDAMRRFLRLEERPTAVFCANDEMAIGAVQACVSAGVRVPEEMSIVGFDAAPGSSYIQPALTTVRQPIPDMVEAAIESIARMFAGEDPIPSTVFPTELIVRASTSRPLEDS
ncbi:MAG: LacI family DNA-binding transcriptional regulator [Fimbriimonadaceae bacterium]